MINPTDAIHAALAARFPSPEWAVFHEIADAAGFGKSRSADAVAMNTWPSRGLSFHGFEMKVSRADWLREKKNPAKSAPVQRFCDFWWIVVANDDIVKDGELPETWGLLVLNGKKLVVKRDAPKLTAQPLDRSFVACLLRAATVNSVSKASVSALVTEQVDERLERHVNGWKQRAESAVEDRRQREVQIAAFARASGISFNQWADGPEIGKAVRFILNEGASAKRVFERLRTHLSGLLENLDGAIAQLPNQSTEGKDTTE